MTTSLRAFYSSIQFINPFPCYGDVKEVVNSIIATKKRKVIIGSPKANFPINTQFAYLNQRMYIDYVQITHVRTDDGQRLRGTRERVEDKKSTPASLTVSADILISSMICYSFPL